MIAMNLFTLSSRTYRLCHLLHPGHLLRSRKHPSRNLIPVDDQAVGNPFSQRFAHNRAVGQNLYYMTLMDSTPQRRICRALQLDRHDTVVGHDQIVWLSAQTIPFRSHHLRGVALLRDIFINDLAPQASVYESDVLSAVTPTPKAAEPLQSLAASIASTTTASVTLLPVLAQSIQSKDELAIHVAAASDLPIALRATRNRHPLRYEQSHQEPRL